jgi:hypothetical protein
MKTADIIKSCGRLVGADELLNVMWSATVAGLNPDGVAPAASAPARGAPHEEFCLVSDVQAAKAEIERRLRARFADGLVEQIAAQIPRLSVAELAVIRDLHANAIAADQ